MKIKNKTDSDIEMIKMAFTVDDIAWYSGDYPYNIYLFEKELQKTDENATIDYGNIEEGMIIIYYNGDNYMYNWYTGKIDSATEYIAEKERKKIKIKVNTGDDGIIALPIGYYSNIETNNIYNYYKVDWGDGNIEDEMQNDGQITYDQKVGARNNT